MKRPFKTADHDRGDHAEHLLETFPLVRSIQPPLAVPTFCVCSSLLLTLVTIGVLGQM